MYNNIDEVFVEALKINGFNPDDVLSGKHKLKREVYNYKNQAVYTCDGKTILVANNDYNITEDDLKTTGKMIYTIIKEENNGEES